MCGRSLIKRLLLLLWCLLCLLCTVISPLIAAAARLRCDHGSRVGGEPEAAVHLLCSRDSTVRAAPLPILRACSAGPGSPSRSGREALSAESRRRGDRYVQRLAICCRVLHVADIGPGQGMSLGTTRVRPQPRHRLVVGGAARVMKLRKSFLPAA